MMMMDHRIIDKQNDVSNRLEHVKIENMMMTKSNRRKKKLSLRIKNSTFCDLLVSHCFVIEMLNQNSR